MNKEEAIKAIKNNWPAENYTMLIEALTMAIEALESKPSVNKEAVINKLNEAFLPKNTECDGGGCMGCWKDVIREAIKMLEQKPSGEGGKSLQELRKEWDKRSNYLKESKNVDTEEIWNLFLPHLQFPSVKQCGCMTHCNCPIFQPPVISDEEIEKISLEQSNNTNYNLGFYDGMKEMCKLLTNK